MMWAFATVLLLASVAAAEDQQPCRREGTNVVCTEAAFTTITYRYLEKDTALKVCDAERKGLQDQNDKLRKTIVECPTPPPCPEKNETLRHVGFALGIIGTAVAVMTPFFPNIGPVAQSVLIAGGAATTGFGYVLTF